MSRELTAPNNEMKLTRSAQFSVARPSQLISVFDGRGERE